MCSILYFHLDATKKSHEKWYGNNYSFEFASDTVTGAVHVVTQKEYDYYFQLAHTLDEHQTVISEEQIADRNAREVLYRNLTGEHKRVFYQLRDASRTISVVEYYQLSTTDNSLSVSRTTPYLIKLFVEDGATLYRVFFLDPEERPSVEWLLSFGLHEV